MYPLFFFALFLLLRNSVIGGDLLFYCFCMFTGLGVVVAFITFLIIALTFDFGIIFWSCFSVVVNVFTTLTHNAVIATKSVESDYRPLKEKVTSQLDEINKIIIGNLGK